MKPRVIALLCALAVAPPVAADPITDELIVSTRRTADPHLAQAGNIAVLETRDHTTLFAADLINRAAGVRVQRGNGQEHLTSIRSPVLTGGAGAGSFLYLEDGIAMRTPAFANVNALMDALPEHAKRIEIVRGPASALYGSNALHGLVNFIGGDIDETATTSETRLGSYGRYMLVHRDSRLKDGVGIRTGLTLAGEDGWRKSAGFTQQKARLEAAWGKRAGVDFHASLSGTRLEQETAGYVRDADCPSARPAYKVKRCAESNPDPDAYRDAHNLRGFVRITHARDNGATLTLTPYLRHNDMDFLLHFLPGKPVEKNGHDALGLQVAYERPMGGALDDLIIGLDIDRTRGTLHEFQSAPAVGIAYPSGLHYDYAVKTLTLAPFLHTRWTLAPRLKGVFGLRFEAANYDYDNRAAGAARIGKLYRPPDRRDRFRDWSPKLGLTYSLAPTQRLFANLSRAARAPQVADLYRQRAGRENNVYIDPDIDGIDSETLTALEAGIRGRTAALSYELAAYAMKKRHHHFRDGADFFVTDGKTKHHGIELDLDWRISPAFALNGSLTWAKHRYDFTRRVSGRNAPESIRRGDAIDSAPETLADATLKWRITPRLRADLHWSHIGRYYLDASNSATYSGHDLLDLSVDVAWSDAVNLRATIFNLADTAYARRADRWFGARRYFPGDRRNVMLVVKARF